MSDHTTIPTKQCSKCGDVFPATTDYFTRDSKKKSGLQLARRRDQHKSARWLYAVPDLIGEEKKASRFKRKDGYVFVSTPGHPRARGWNDHVQEHIIVMEKHIGRYLQDREVVHHKNGIRHDNRIENLELWVRPHPPGQRVSDLVEWATEFLREYAPERLVEGDRVGGS